MPMTSAKSNQREKIYALNNMKNYRYEFIRFGEQEGSWGNKEEDTEYAYVFDKEEGKVIKKRVLVQYGKYTF